MTTPVGGPIVSAMKWSPLRLLLVVLMLFGLVGQTAVYAMAPLAAPAVSTIEVAAPSDDCAGMAMNDGDEMPCTGITLDCIARMGCVAPPVLVPAADLSSHEVAYTAAAYDTRLATFVGLTIPPDIFPPIG